VKKLVRHFSMIIMIISILVAGLIFLSCTLDQKAVQQESPGKVSSLAQSSVQVKEDWEDIWGKTLQEAKREGILNINIWGGPNIRETVSKAFKEKYNLDIAWSAGGGLELAEKVLRERKAGIYLADMCISGPGTFVTVLKPAGILEPLEPEFILPEVKDSKLWAGGKLPFYDKDGIIAYLTLTPMVNIFVNKNFTTKEQIQSYRDLLDPKWKGKITWGDPTQPGPGSQWFIMIGGKIMGYDFMKEMAKQEPVFSRDRRTVVEWVARGKYAIGIGSDKATILQFIEAGAPLEQLIPREGTYLGTGGSNTVIFKNAPHPNARKIFINWLLSKEGQTVWSQAVGDQSAREDVPTNHIPADGVRQPGINYPMTSEEADLTRDSGYALAKEIFGTLLK